MRILDRYVTRQFLATFGVVLLFILGIFLVVHVFSMIDSLLEARASLEAQGYTVIGVLSQYYAVSIPFFFLVLAPFVTIIAAAITLIRLMRGNELTPMVAAGRSHGRIALPLFACSGILAAGMLAMQEWAVPRLAKSRILLERLADGDVEGKIDDLPFLTDEKGNTWRVDLWIPARWTIEGVRVLRFEDPEGGPSGNLYVRRAVFRDEGPEGPGWYPEAGHLLPEEGRGVITLSPDERLHTELHPDRIRSEAEQDKREAGRMLSLSDAARLVRRYPDLPRQRVAFHSLITWPLGCVLLLFLGLPFVSRFGERNLFVGIGIALLVCALYLGVTTICQDLGGRATLPPTFAAWLPVVLFVSAAIALQDALRG